MSKVSVVPVYIDPSSIYGWREGASFDVSVGAASGFSYPKSQKRYDAVLGVVPDVSDHGANALAAQREKRNVTDLVNHAHEVFDSIQEAGRFDEPVVVYEADGRRYLLHGALRLSCAAMIRASDPSAFQQVPAVLFDGSPDQAREAMFSYQRELACRVRSLTLQEQVRAIARMFGRGMIGRDIVALMRWKAKPWYVDGMMGLSTLSDDELSVMDDEIAREQDVDEARGDAGVDAHGGKSAYVRFIEHGLSIIASKHGRAKEKKPERPGSRGLKILRDLSKVAAGYPEGAEIIGMLNDASVAFNGFVSLATDLAARRSNVDQGAGAP